MQSVSRPESMTPTARLVDAGLAIAVLVAGLVQTWPAHAIVAVPDGLAVNLPRFAPTLTAIAVALPLWYRRSRPVMTVLVVLVGLAGSGVTGVELPTGPIALSVAIYSVARYARSSGVSALVLVVAMSVEGAVAVAQRAGTEWLVFVVIVALGLWSIGDAGRRDEERTGRLEEAAARHAAERQAAEEHAADAERARIAREIHDVIAHDMTVIVVQAGAAARIVERDPDEARRSLEAIERTGREALVEVRRLLGVLRRGDSPLANDPQPTLARLDPLLADIRRAGLSVELRIEGDAEALAPGVDVSAYRLIQEALTNALRHAPGCHATVVISYGPGSVEIDVVNDGPQGAATAPEPAPAQGVGHGLAGMRERVALLDGELNAGPMAGGGFQVRARLPIEAVA